MLSLLKLSLIFGFGSYTLFAKETTVSHNDAITLILLTFSLRGFLVKGIGILYSLLLFDGKFNLGYYWKKKEILI